jgi:hypothetical protein
VEAFALLFLLLLALSFDREHTVLQVNLDLVLVHVGQVCLDDEFTVGLEDVHCRHEVGEGLAGGLRGPIEEQAVEPLLELVDLGEGVDTGELL